MRLTWTLVILGAVAAPAPLADEASAARWFPLGTGNRWMLREAETGSARTVRCTVGAGRRTLVGLPGLGPLQVRIGSRTLYVREEEGVWQSFLRFGESSSRAWEVRFEPFGRVHARWQRRDETLELPAGTFAGCRRLALSAVPGGTPRPSPPRALWFAPDLGLVRIEGAAGEVLDLAAADIGDDVYPSGRAERKVAGPRPGTPLLLSVADTEQADDASCGSAAMQAALAHYGVAVAQARLTREAKTDPESGTAVANIVEVAERYGIHARYREGYSLEEAAREVLRGDPVLVLCMAWRDDDEVPWSEDWESGHYLVVVGIDDGAVYFEDPSLKGARGVIPRREFLTRWHGWTDEDEQVEAQAILFRAGDSTTPVPARDGSKERWVRIR